MTFKYNWCTNKQSSGYYNNTAPTSTVIQCRNECRFNKWWSKYDSLLFCRKKRFSKFGNYTGNGNADGPFVYTGFKPAFVLIKKLTDTGTNWVMFDNKRDGYNVINKYYFLIQMMQKELV